MRRLAECVQLRINDEITEHFTTVEFEHVSPRSFSQFPFSPKAFEGNHLRLFCRVWQEISAEPAEHSGIIYGTIGSRGDFNGEKTVNPDEKLVDDAQIADVVTKAKYIVLVPLRMNDGSEVDPNVILDFQDDLFANFGGFTNGGTVEGQYKMHDGKKAVDHTIQYWIGIEESQQPLLRSIVSELGKKLGQESMYLEKTGATIDFVEPASALCNGHVS